MTHTSLLSRLVRSVLLALYRLRGSTVERPSVIPRRCVIVGAPHTTNWDFIYFLGAAHEVGLKAAFVGKTSLFRWPFGRFMRDMGGIAVDRSRRSNYVDQLVRAFDGRSDLALVIAPEGTRGESEGFRSGFYHVANGAQVPIVPAWVDDPKRRGGIGEPIETTGNFAADLARISAFYFAKMPDHPKLAALYAQAGLFQKAAS